MIQWSNDPSIDHVDQWSDESLSRVDLIDHWSENGFARKERHRSEIQIRLLPKERTLSTLILSGYSKKLKISYCKTRFYAMNIKVTFPLIPTHNFWKKIFIIQTAVLYRDFRPEKSRNNIREKISYFFTCVDIANQLLTRHSPLALLGQVDEWMAKPSRFSIQVVCRSFLELWRLKH